MHWWKSKVELRHSALSLSGQLEFGSSNAAAVGGIYQSLIPRSQQTMVCSGGNWG
jgi:hypothetical protein